LTGFEIRFFQQGFVLLGHHVVLHLGHEIHGHHHNDQQRRSTKVKGHVVFQNQELGQQAHKGDVNRASKCQTHQNFVDIARYIDKILVRLTLAGAVYITFVCLLPEFLILKYNVPFYFGGTSLLIIVVVTMDFMAQVQNYMMSQQYESLLKKANFKPGQ